ncbi:hypothetical protein QTO34_001465 [Cnephaeus nilssonii]|uniref:40S ribosomal protein S26 n=1 Tax=Cnephaeus nilssonii TaxID=3371016 RepID=A0AA40HVX6_CNENI|nr:hypothetical protein QTO34_001465 [Eptesicus nilssonii]
MHQSTRGVSKDKTIKKSVIQVLDSFSQCVEHWSLYVKLHYCVNCAVHSKSRLVLTPAASTSPTRTRCWCRSRSLGTISGCERQLPAPIAPEGFSTSPCS